MSNILTSIIGNRNDRILKKYNKIIQKINIAENKLTNLSEEQIKLKTLEFKERINKGESLDNILPEAFALVKISINRIWNIIPYDVQLLGGIILHNGKIAEMRTGEGKTLTATFPAYLNALTGKGVHIITVNDYLAKRDAEKMGKLFSYLGLTTECNINGLTHEEKKQAYLADITYGTNNEFGFDYLRNNMVYDVSDKVQRELNYAIIDEVDSILIDEARTPLIISGQDTQASNIYSLINSIPLSLEKGVRKGQDKDFIESGDYVVDLKTKQVHLTEQGHEKSEKMMVELGLISEEDSLYSTENLSLLLHLQAALKAHTLFHLNQHYIIQDNEIKIVDEHTGRIMNGRRWSEGLHQAIEAKEGVDIQPENITQATITLQNYFRMYNKLSGMTGTADTEAFEFNDIYGLETIVVPTNKPIKRNDLLDQVFMTTEGKIKAIIDDVKYNHELGRPILIGTSSIENNELLSNALTNAGLKHEVLNAKQHERESYIISQAGKSGSITIATNMAGRGTDIILGGNIENEILKIKEDETLSDETKKELISDIKSQWVKDNNLVLSLGGLHVIGTERHESRRIDNQLRGRSGRQGDPGSSIFYVSFEDPLLKIFSGSKAIDALKRLRINTDEAIQHPFVSKNLASAQKRVESHHYDIRKQLLDYDGVSNQQRSAIYKQRNEILHAESEYIEELAKEMLQDSLDNTLDYYIPLNSYEEQWDIAGLKQVLINEYDSDIPFEDFISQHNYTTLDIRNKVKEIVLFVYKNKETWLKPEILRDLEKKIILECIDQGWREQITGLDYLRNGIHLRGYAQKDPKQEYKIEAFKMFENLLISIKKEVSRYLMSIQPIPQENFVDIIPDNEDKKELETNKES